MARSRIYYWIPQAAKIVKGIKRKLNIEAMTQLMAPVPAFRLKSSPPWNHSMIDLFGPIEVKDFVNQRTTRKTWAVLITCLSSRAVQAYLAESFSTDHLLSALAKHEARNGCPQIYYADLGTQIVGADRVFSEAINNLDKKVLTRQCHKNETEFKVSYIQ